ncbi:5-carboxymethyl-2-hydroxymuconate isomerase [Achromatium sp. WMS3]|nr:5-carboxymethyl-2-hydroxymuconate isomerase [Achromatium sp. WMS3]
MRIIRFLDPQNQVHYGIPNDTGLATELTGNTLTELIPKTRQIQISRLLAPIIPTNMYCIGLNYADHAAETGAKTPEHPVVFMKPTSTINHPDATITIPACCTHGPEVDFEAELAVIIGQKCKDVSASYALKYVFAYTIANDISARKWQKHAGGGQWIRGKSFDGFCPLGPVLVTADTIPNPQDLWIRSTLNGQIMQDSHTSNMIFSVAHLISFLSQDTTLLPGTVILTGTPAGVGMARTPPRFLQPNDSIEIAIENIGSLTNSIIAA